MKERYICTISDAIKCMLPAGIGVKAFRIAHLKVDSPQKNKNRQKLIEILKQNEGRVEYDELTRLSGIKSIALHINALEAEGCIEIHEEFTTAVKEKYVRVAYLSMPVEEVRFELDTNKIKKIQQIRVLEMLMDNEYISTADLARFAGVSPAVLDTLRKNRYIEYKEIEVVRNPVKFEKYERTVPFNPTLQQAAALEALYSKLEEKSFHQVLVHGVTGSGKTEVYLQLIQRVIENGKQAIVLVPEISLTPQMVERFAGRFGSAVAVLHSRLSPGEKYDQWRLIKSGRIKVAVGARSAVFAPFDKLGVIIVDEEHETSYKSETTPKYRVSEIAEQRCGQESALLIFGSATPSVETYYKALNGEIQLIKMLDRANLMVMPRVHVADMRKELENGNRSVFSEMLSEEIRKNHTLGQQTILFLNKRGYASSVLCRSCGFTARCRQCNISLTYHSHDDRLICHYCGYTVKMPSQCPKCSSGYFKQFGTGTQRIEEDIKKHFPQCSVIRMDMDTTSGKNSHEEILTKFRNEKIDILVGTQMIAKGHDFPNVTLVGVLAADSMLNLDDFKAAERTFQLVTQVSGRAGRGELPGRVVIQTYNTDDFSINSACKHNYEGFYSQEIKIRQKLSYPPFTNIASIITSSKEDRPCYDRSVEIAGALKKQLHSFGIPEPLVLGPLRAPLAKIKGRYRWRIIIKCNSMETLVDVLANVYDSFKKAKDSKEVDISMDINPFNML